MPKFSCVKCVRMLAELLGMLHISLVSLPKILSNFVMSGLENGTAYYTYVIRGFMTVFRILIFCLRLVGDRASSLFCCLAFWRMISLCSFHLRDSII